MKFIHSYLSNVLNVWTNKVLLLHLIFELLVLFWSPIRGLKGTLKPEEPFSLDFLVFWSFMMSQNVHYLHQKLKLTEPVFEDRHGQDGTQNWAPDQLQKNSISSNIGSCITCKRFLLFDVGLFVSLHAYQTMHRFGKWKEKQIVQKHNIYPQFSFSELGPIGTRMSGDAGRGYALTVINETVKLLKLEMWRLIFCKRLNPRLMLKPEAPFWTFYIVANVLGI